MKTTKITYTKTDGLWFPVTENTIDRRAPGKRSKREVREQLRERSEYTGQKFTAKFN